MRAEIFAVVLFLRISRVKPSRKCPLEVFNLYYVYFYSADNIRTPVQYTYVYRIRVLHYKRSTVLRAVAKGGGGGWGVMTPPPPPLVWPSVPSRRRGKKIKK